MKINHVLSKVNLNNLNNKRKYKAVTLNLAQNYSNSLQLSNFNTIGKSLITFGANLNNGDIDLSKMSVQELQGLKQMYTADRSQQEAKRKDAQEKLNRINNWNYSEEYQKQGDMAAAEINRCGLSTFWNPFQCRDIRSKHYTEFLRKSREIDDLKTKKDLYEQIVNMSSSDVKKNRTFVSQIDIMIAQKQQIEAQERRLRGIEGINKAIEAMGNAKGGLDDRIAGYDYEKDELRRIFINPLVQSQKDPSVEVPPVILLYGANGTGKTTFLNGIATEGKSDEYAVVEQLPPVDTAIELKEALKNIFHKAKVRYLEENEDWEPKRVRTILLINDAERFFGMSYDQAKAVYGDLINEADEAKLKGINHDAEIIDRFKSIFDDCSGVPEEPDHTLANAATTIFITTNYPHLIDRDLLRKMDIFAINPAKGKNMEEVMKFYFKKCSDVLEAIKDRAKDPDFNSDDLKFVKKYISESSVSKLMQYAKNGELNNLKISYNTIPFENIANAFRPNLKTGAFDNRQLQQLSIQALNQYIQDPTQNYEEYYYMLLFNAKRMLDPVRYKHHVDIFNTLAPLNKQEGKEDRQRMLEEKLALYRMEKAGILSDKNRKKLDYIKAQDSQELNYLQTKKEQTVLSDEEQERFNWLLEEKRIIQEDLLKLGDSNNDTEDEDF